MMDLQKGQLILDQPEDSNQQNDLMDKMNKSVLTPNMFGRHKTRRGNETFVSSNPYVKFKKENDLAQNPSATLRS